MPILNLTADEARMRMRANRAYGRWWAPESAPQELRDLAACERLKSSVFRPRIKPRFNLKADDGVFAIGSCFAREIEQSMIRDGFRVVSDPGIFAQWKPRQHHAAPWTDNRVFAMGYVNKFTIGAMIDELRWAAMEFPSTTHPAVQEIAEGHFVDFGAHNVLAGHDEATVRARRQAMSSLMRGAYTANVIVLTLGVAESWRDRQSGLHVVDNAITLRASDPSRFELQIVSHGDELAGLHEIATLLDQHGRPDWRMVITVSPVPLIATFTGDDIVTANSYSKSVLRGAAGQFARECDRVDYFPSYEMAMFSDPSIVWELDRRHVRREFVAEIVAAFRDAYIAS